MIIKDRSEITVYRQNNKCNTYGNSYNVNDIYPDYHIILNNLKTCSTVPTEVEPSDGIGYIELYVFKSRGKEAVPDATVTVYARVGEENAVPIKTFVTTTNPITLDLPVAHPSGTLIQGPEYYFTTYNLEIQADGYFLVNVLNIRMFPGITTNFDINLIEFVPGGPVQERVIYIPPHPRDVIGNKFIH